jgi:hypothetical protein
MDRPADYPSAASPGQDNTPGAVSLIGAGTIRPRTWRITFAIILLAGFILAGTGYRHGLPFIDFPDEVTIWTMGRAAIDSSWVMYQPQYPPGFVAISSAVQRAQIALGDPYVNPAGTVEVMRLMSVCATVVALAAVMLLAYRFAGPVAGVAAGLFWMLLPLVNLHAKRATVDPWLSAWFTLSVACGIEAWHRKSIRWMAASLVFGILAALFKWQGAAALGMAGLDCLVFWRVNRRRVAMLLVAYGLVVGALGYWAVFIHHALEGSVYLPGTQTSIPTPTTLAVNLYTQLTATGPFLIVGALPVLALFLSVALPAMRRRLHVQMALWALPIIVVVFNLILSVNGAPVFTRHYLAATALLAALGGVGFTLTLQAIQQIARHFRRPRLSWTLTAALCVVIAVPLLDAANQSLAQTIDDLRPDSRAYLAEWARTTATEGPLLITNPTLAAAVQTIYGYRGRPIETPYNEGTSIVPDESQITQQMIDAEHIRYVIASPHYKNERLTTPLTRLITIGPGDDLRGEAWAAYYVGTLPQWSADRMVTFGNEVSLRGMSLSKQTACPGDSLDLQLLWGAVKTPSRYYSIYIHLFNAKTGELDTPISGQPVSDERPTTSWIRPDELLIGPHYTWSLPADLPPGDYQLWLGVFDPVGGTRLTTLEGSDHDVLETIRIVECRTLGSLRLAWFPSGSR